MKCNKATRLVEKLADGEASPRERVLAESHLEQCEECRSHFRFVRALQEASSQLVVNEPPESYWDLFPSKVLARLDREEVDERRGFWAGLLTPRALRFGAAAATLTVMVAVGVTVLRDDQVAEELTGAAPAGAQRRTAEEDAVSPGQAEPGAMGELRALETVNEPAPASPTPPSPPSMDAPPARAPAMGRDEARVSGVPRERREQAPADADRAETADATEPLIEDLRDAPVASPSARARSSEMRTFTEAPEEDERAKLASETVEENVGARPSSASPPAAPGEAVPATAALAQSESADPCELWRRYLERYGAEGDDASEARYQLARCALDELASDPSEEDREAALETLDAFLVRESDTERAREIRTRREELRR